ncbi:aminotransferase class V-fold PLP-dependent enzyme, partial [Nocardioides ungokensis]
MTNASGTSGPGPGPVSPAYLDSASSEPLHPAAREILLAALDQGYADPRRLHGPARSARLMLDNAREVVAGCLGVRRDEVTFTASGTDAVHRGLLGLLAARPQGGGTVVASAVEHSAVLHATEWVAGRGVTTTLVPVDRLGRVSVDDVVEAASAGGVSAVAVQAANHEVGTLQPVAEIGGRLDG